MRELILIFHTTAPALSSRLSEPCCQTPGSISAHQPASVSPGTQPYISVRAIISFRIPCALVLHTGRTTHQLQDTQGPGIRELGPRSIYQWAQHAPGPPGLQPWSLVCWYQLQDVFYPPQPEIPGPGSIHQWDSTSPGPPELWACSPACPIPVPEHSGQTTSWMMTQLQSPTGSCLKIPGSYSWPRTCHVNQRTQDISFILVHWH